MALCEHEGYVATLIDTPGISFLKALIINVWGGGVNSQSAARKKHYLRRIVYKRFMYEENLNA